MAQIELNRRLLPLDRSGRFAGDIWSTAFAWATRGAWDSALVAMDRYAALNPGELGAQDLSPCGGRRMARRARPCAGRSTAGGRAKYLARLPAEDSSSARGGRGGLAWADGMLAVLRRDPHGLATARVSVQQSGAEGAGFMNRSLAAFEMELRGAKRAAADSLADLDLAASERGLLARVTRTPGPLTIWRRRGGCSSSATPAERSSC